MLKEMTISVEEDVYDTQEAKRKSDELVDRFYGAWEDDKSAEEMIAEIRADRRSGGREIEPL
ncbi:hypothetical protein AGMMS49942_09620 [Spirochaetia bacterium]|nr:hypothetical protein AGMMS49942_09620 [Spirochaetia bacterium]